MKIYSGHGPSTTIGYERKFNPFLNVWSFVLGLPLQG
jgi:hypothetical protein